MIASAGAATTPTSSFSKTGVDATTGSTATETTSGSTAAGHTIDWVLSYRNTTAASAQVNITDPINGNQTYVPGSLQTPPGFSGQWSTNGGASYAGSEPASGVNGVGATGTSGPGSTGSQSVVQPPSTGFNAGSTQGDGWEPLFIGGNVYNVHHHAAAGSTTTALDCHNKTTGATCPGYPVSSVPRTAGQPFTAAPDPTDTAYGPNAAVNAAAGRIYFPVGIDGQGGIGVLCADVVTEVSCGYTQLAVSPVANRIEGGEGHPAIDGGAVIGTHYYLVDAQANVYCFDTAAHAPCGAPYPLPGVPGYNGGAPNTTSLAAVLDSRLQAFDGRYVLGNIAEPDGRRDLTCLDTTTNSLCPGFPVRNYAIDYHIAGGPTQFNSVVAPILNANSAVTGICGLAATNATTAPFKCYSIGGASSGSLVPTPWPQQVLGDTVTRAGLGSITTIGSKAYFPYSLENGAFPTTYACWDFATSAPCVGFVQASSGQNLRAYTIRQDPYNPDCVWELGDAGVFELFSATFGGTTCNEGTSQVAVTPATSYCDGKSGHVTGWNDLLLSGVTSGDYNAAAVSITDENGNPVPGWTGRVFPNTQQTIDISSIPYSRSTTSLHVSISIAWGSHPVRSAALGATFFTGDPVQVCFKTVVGPAKCATAQSITNTGTAVTVADNGDSDAPAGNRSGTTTFTQASDLSLCEADLQIVKSAASGVIVPGTNSTYALDVRNNGPDAAQGAVVADRLPDGLSFVSASPGCSFANGTVTCRLSSLAAGASDKFTVVAHVAGSVDHRITNTAHVFSNTRDNNPANDTSTTTQPLNQRVDLAITKTSSRTIVPPGGQVNYTLVVTNNGPSDATGVTVTDDVPTGLSLVTAHPAQGSCTISGALSCSLGWLAAGGSTQILVTANVASGFHGSLSNVAKVTPDQLDTNPANNTSMATVAVPTPAPPSEPTSDLAIVKRVSSGSAFPGRKLTYTLSVTNHGPDAATGVRVTDTSSLPLRVLSAHSSQGSCHAGRPLTCLLGTIRARAHVTITVVAKVKAAGEQINAASASSASQDTNSSNNLSRAKSKITPVLRLLKSVSPTVVHAGHQTIYAIKVTNPTSITLHSLKTCDALPAGLRPVSGSPQPRLSAGKYCWKLGALRAGKSRSYRLTVRVLLGVKGSLSNQATTTASGTRRALARAKLWVIAAPPPSTGLG